jgi:hypothetical protein
MKKKGGELTDRVDSKSLSPGRSNTCARGFGVIGDRDSIAMVYSGLERSKDVD